MSTEIYYDKPCDLDSIGRNRYSRACGISITRCGNELVIENITSADARQRLVGRPEL